MHLGQRFRVRHPGIVSEVIEGEAVIVNLETGDYFSMAGAGAFVWGLLEKQISAEDILKRVFAHYEGDELTISSSVEQILKELEDEGLIVDLTEPAESIESCSSPVITDGLEKTRFETPVLEKYTDLSELLFLDPIHEVDDTGWPAAAEKKAKSIA